MRDGQDDEAEATEADATPSVPESFDPSRHPSFVRARNVSLAALRLHSLGVSDSIDAGRRGFVPDTYLDELTDIDPDIALAVLELTMGGIWARADDGYRVLTFGGG